MGLTQSIIGQVLEFHKTRGFHGDVVTLGNQDIWASSDELEKLFRDHGVDPIEVSAPIPSDSAMFSRLDLGNRNYVHARTFFEMMGLTGYADIDVSSVDAPVIIHDLNEPVPSELHRKYDLVLDGGTAEHVFDTRTVLESMARMVRVGGHVVHVSPVAGYIGHGMFSFSPDTLFEFYAANGFVNCEARILSVVSALSDHRYPARVFAYKYGSNINGLIDPKRKTVMIFVATCDSLGDDVAVPIQGWLSKNLAAQNRSCTHVSQVPAPPFVPNWLRPVADPLRPVLFPIWRRVRPLVGRKAGAKPVK
jgi:hypothetical protein